MKKILTLSLVTFMTLSVAAQVQVAEQVRPMSNSNIKSQTEQKTAVLDNSTKASITPRRATVSESDALCYLRPQGGFNVGVSSDFGMYYPMILVDDVEFTLRNISNLTSKDSLWWYFPTANGIYYDYAWDYVAKKPLDYTTQIEAGYMIYTPILGTEDLEGNVNNMYQWGAEYSNNSVIISRLEEPMPMTTCAMYDGVGAGDFYMIGAGQYGEYAYGSNLKLEFEDEPGVVYIPDTMVVIYDNLTTLWMDSLFLPIYNRNANSVADMIPAGAEIKFDILKVELKDNTFMIGDVITSTTATQADLYAEQFSNGTGYLGVLNAAFGAKNSFGGFRPEPLTVTGMFAVQISGFSSNGCNFGVYADYNYPTGDTFFKFANTFSRIWQGGGNIGLSINAMFTDPQTDAVENINATNGVEKVVVDGQVLIRKGDKTYNVLGAEVK